MKQTTGDRTIATYVTSGSTDVEVFAAYEDNATYDLEASATKCRQFICACRVLLLRRPATVAQGGTSVSEAPELIQTQLSQAEEWLAANDSTASTRATGAVRYYGVEAFR